MSPRVISSGKDPPVFSNKDLRKAPSSGVESVSASALEENRYRNHVFAVRMNVIPIPNRSATPGRNQTGSTANFVTANSPKSLRHIFLSGTRRPSRTLCSISGIFICALVIAILGLIWIFSSRIISENSQGLKWPHGSMDTIFFHWGKGPMFKAGPALVKSGL